MPRVPRLDVEGGTYHVIARGLDRGPIFRDDRDRQGFLQRMARLAGPQEISLLAYVLMDNHVHVVLQRGPLRLATFMARLLTGHAVVFNRRYGRCGHLFQNRYRSILCDADAYLLELVRYVHLNPVRAGLVTRPEQYGWSSHRGYLSGQAPAWMRTDLVVEMLGGRQAFERFVLAATDAGRRPELSGVAVTGAAGERRVWCNGQVLGSEEFVRTVTKTTQNPAWVEGTAMANAAVRLEALARRVAAEAGVPVAAICSPSRQAPVAAARRRLVAEAVRAGSLRPVDVSRFLGVSRAAITLSLTRAAARAR